MGWPRRILIAAGIATVAAGVTLAVGRVSYAPMPDRSDLLNPDRYPIQTAFDILGRRVSRAEADRLKATAAGRAELAPESRAVAIDPAMVERGRQAFYQETFGNEVFLTDVMGMLDGGPTPLEVALRGGPARRDGHRRTFRSPWPRTCRIGDRVYRAGELIPTGLDVPKGGAFIIGIKTFYDRGHLRMGITCALCHAAVDPGTGKVVEGAPNTDLNAGSAVGAGQEFVRLLHARQRAGGRCKVHRRARFIPARPRRGRRCRTPRRWRRPRRCRWRAGRPAASTRRPIASPTRPRSRRASPPTASPTAGAGARRSGPSPGCPR
ncbi:hypothetical protein ACU4GR_19405 [Methylobacterium oryzae CBMB20]